MDKGQDANIPCSPKDLVTIDISIQLPIWTSHCFLDTILSSKTPGSIFLRVLFLHMRMSFSTLLLTSLIS